MIHIGLTRFVHVAYVFYTDLSNKDKANEAMSTSQNMHVQDKTYKIQKHVTLTMSELQLRKSIH